MEPTRTQSLGADMLGDPPQELAAPAWRALEARHQHRVAEATAAYRARRRDHRAHPVEDFLFTYYNFTPAKLGRWHPGARVVLAEAARMPRASWRHYRCAGDGVMLDVAGFLAARRSTVDFVRTLLTRTLSRPAHLGCFGMHEWAMVYRLGQGEIRHPAWPLRLGDEGTDAVVEAIRSAAATSTRSASSRRRRDRATPSGRPGSRRPPWSNRDACTRGWTSTSGPSG